MCTVQNTTKMNEVFSWKDRLLASKKQPPTPPVNTSVSHMVRNSAQTKTNETGRTRNQKMHAKASTRTAPPNRQNARQNSRQNAQHMAPSTSAPAQKENTKTTTSTTKGPSRAVQAKSNVQLFHSKWTLYYHNPNSNDWSNASYRRILQFNSVEAFCAYYKEMEFEECAQGMFFLMRGDIMPTWEDEHNKNGGCWSFKVSLEHFFYVWKHLSALLVGETLSSKPLLLNGISVSPKRGFCIVKLWNHDSTLNKTDVLKLENVEYLEDNGPALYTPFNTKK